MLNTKATYDKDKSEEAVESLAVAFSLRQPVKGVPQVITSTGLDIMIEQFYEEMRQVTASFVPIEEIKVEVYGERMEIAFPTKFLFNPGSVEVRDYNASFLNQVAESVSRWQNGLLIDTEIVMSAPESFAIGAELDHINITRSTRIAEYLEEVGVNGITIATGLSDDSLEQTRLHFTVRPLEKPSPDLGARELPEEVRQ
jgi:hypothetical protein